MKTKLVAAWNLGIALASIGCVIMAAYYGLWREEYSHGTFLLVIGLWDKRKKRSAK